MVSVLPLTVNACVRTYGSTTFLPSSSIATPRITSPLAEYLLLNSISQGISAWHGSHQVAQKFTSTIFPCCSASDVVPPSSVGSATFRSAGSGPPAAPEFDPPPAPLPQEETTDAASKHIRAESLVSFASMEKTSPYKSVQETQFTR